MLPSSIDIINKWRAAFNLPPMSWDPELGTSAFETAEANHGSGQNHHLPPFNGARKVGEVIAPGNSDHLDSYGDFSLRDSLPLLALRGEDRPRLPRPSVPRFWRPTGSGIVRPAGLTMISCSTRSTHIGCGFFRNPDAPSSSIWNGLYVCAVRSD